MDCRIAVWIAVCQIRDLSFRVHSLMYQLLSQVLWMQAFNDLSQYPIRYALSYTRDLSSAGRASALQAEGHRFEPYRPHLNGWIPEWPKGTDCKSAATCFGGSNPPPSIGSWKRTILYNIAGWSSLEARRAHNPKVVGSNPAPATSNNQRITLVIFFYIKWTQNKLLRYNRTINH